MKNINANFIKNGINGTTEEDGKNILNNENRILKMLTGVLSGLVNDVKTMLRLVKAYYSGEYRDIPWCSIAAVIFALVYLLNPIDLIPDVIPFIGLTDDAAVISVVIMMIESDLDAFRQWEATEGFAS